MSKPRKAHVLKGARKAALKAAFSALNETLPLAIEHVAPSALKAAPYNPRRMSAEARAKLERGIVEFGLVDPIIARRKDRMVIGGHQRLASAIAMGITSVPVVYLDGISDARAKALNILLNNPNAAGEYDNDLLTEALRSLADDGFDLSLTAFNPDELDALLSPPGILDGADLDAVPEPPKKPVTKVGDLIVMGRHRLVCGDSRDFGTVERLMDGRKINVAFTSPPYASQRKYDESSGFKPIKPDEYVAWYRDVAANIMAQLADDGSYFCNIKEHCEDGQRHLYVTDLLVAHVREWGWRWVDEYCWLRAGIPGDPNLMGHFKNAWESVFWFAQSSKPVFKPESVQHETQRAFRYTDQVKRGKKFGAINQGVAGENNPQDLYGGMAYPSNVIADVKGTADALGHAAAFPVALPAFFIKAHSDTGDAIFDPFLGSGTTLIAAEMEGRSCYGIELSPAYCDVIVQRFEKATGQQAVRP